jgi:cytochrome c biogenesis protein CcdA
MLDMRRCALIFILMCTLVHGITAQQTAESAPNTVVIDFYFSEGCRACLEFVQREIPGAAERAGIDVLLNTFDLLSETDYERFAAEIVRLEEKVIEVPVAIIGNLLLQGDDTIRRELDSLFTAIGKRLSAGATVDDAIEGAAKELGLFGEVPVGDSSSTEKALYAVPVLLAGLLDGVNPCAFTTLIFLIAALAVAGRSRREIFILGLFFTLSVFVTYFFIGFGFFQAIRAASSFPIIATVIRWVLFSILLVFSALSVVDWTRIRNGRANKIILQLPMAMKRRIHGSIRSYARTASLVGSALVLGVLVSVFELACTGQVYFPTLAYLARADSDVRSFLLLGLYNVGFILPLLVVFSLSYAGVSSDRVTRVFQQNLGLVKLATAVLFLVLAILTVTL